MVQTKAKKNKNNKVFVVHRLDKDTSGLIVFAKSELVKKKLQNNWNQSIRNYVAVVNGNVEKDKETGNGHPNDLRTRLWINGQINDDWSYTGMLENIQCFCDDDGEEDTDFQRAYVEGKLGGMNVLAGRYNAFLVNGNLYDTRADGVELNYGKDIKEEIGIDVSVGLSYSKVLAKLAYKKSPFGLSGFWGDNK